MKYSEFKERIEVWGQKHGYVIRVIIGNFNTDIKVESDGAFYFNTYISNEHRFVLNTDWIYFKEIEENARGEFFSIIFQLATTPIEGREDEKSFIIPLPGLVTTDGKQQYLSQDYNFFASRRDRTLKQTWKEEDLKFVPEIYRQFAEEFGKGKELEDDYKK